MLSRRIRSGLAAAAAAALLLPAAGQVKDHTKIKYPALPEFHIPRPEVFELDNGMKVFLLEDHELPLISAYTRIRTGSFYEPAEKAGLAGLTGQLLREGGTRSKSGDELDDYLADRAASIETSIGGEAGSASMSCLKGDFDEVFRMFAEVLRHPAFAEDKLEVAKVQANTGIARRNDDVGQITSREFSRLMYGADSPIGRLQEYSTIAAITRDDLVAWHGRFYHPNNVYLGLVGDFDSAAMKSTIREVFGDWAKGPAFGETEPAFAQPQPGVYYIRKNDVTQANIRMGHHGIRIDNPDYFAVQVMNEVLGGSFASRLFSNVRSKKGLAYSVFGSVGSSYTRPGVCQVGLQTKSETMAKAVEALRVEATGMIERPPLADELQRAKDAILNSFVFNYASRAQVLNQQLTYAYYGLPADFLETYRANIEKVTREQVAAAAKKYIHPDEMVLLVVGKQEDFDRPVSSFGEVTELDITIPEMPDTSPKIARTEAGLREGAELWSRVAGALGGERLGEANAFRATGSIAVSMGGQSMALTQTTTVVFPDRARIEIDTPMGQQVVVVNPDAGYVAAGGQTMDMPEARLDEQRKSLMRSIQMLLRYHDDPEMETIAGTEETIEDTACRILLVRFHGAESRLWIADDGRVLKQAYQGRHPMTGAPGAVETFLADYRDVGGVRLPHRQVMKIDGQEFATMTLQEIEFDPEIEATLFEKPGA